MAKLPDGIFGGFRGRIGNVVGVKRNGTYYIRSVPASIKNPNTPKQKGNRNRFGQASKLATLLQPFLVLTHAKNHEKGWRGAFISNNMKSAFFTDEDGTVHENYAELILSSGILKPVETPLAIFLEDENIVRFTWTDNSGEGNALHNDRVYILIFDPMQKMLLYENKPVIRGDESMQLSVPESLILSPGGWIFLSVISKDSMMASNSICLGTLSNNTVRE